MFLLAPFTPHIDIFITRLFFSGQKGVFYNPLPFQLLYKYGEILGFIIGGITLVILFFSFLHNPLKKYRNCCLAFLLTLIIGAGLLTNTLLKEYWGRPRPTQIVEFGGQYPYRPFYKPNFFPETSQKSFPSGHVAMGFCSLSFCFSWQRLRNKRLYYTAITLTIMTGCGLMIARIAQGGHFFSDVLFSFVLIWLVAFTTTKIVYHLFSEDQVLDHTSPPSSLS